MSPGPRRRGESPRATQARCRLHQRIGRSTSLRSAGKRPCSSGTRRSSIGTSGRVLRQVDGLHHAHGPAASSAAASRPCLDGARTFSSSSYAVYHLDNLVLPWRFWTRIKRIISLARGRTWTSWIRRSRTIRTPSGAIRDPPPFTASSSSYADSTYHIGSPLRNPAGDYGTLAAIVVTSAVQYPSSHHPKRQPVAANAGRYPPSHPIQRSHFDRVASGAASLNYVTLVGRLGLIVELNCLGRGVSVRFTPKVESISPSYSRPHALRPRWKSSRS